MAITNREVLKTRLVEAEEAYHKLWSKKERSKIQKEDPNKWEQKGEDAADSAINRAVWKVLRHIGW